MHQGNSIHSTDHLFIVYWACSIQKYCSYKEQYYNVKLHLKKDGLLAYIRDSKTVVPDSNVGWANVGSSSGRQYWCWTIVGSTYIDEWDHLICRRQHGVWPRACTSMLQKISLKFPWFPGMSYHFVGRMDDVIQNSRRDLAKSSDLSRTSGTL